MTTKKMTLAPPPAELPVEAVQARRFEKARSAQAAAVHQNDHPLETGGASHLEALSGRVPDAGGAWLADRVRSRHRLVVNVLRAVGVPEQCAELDAEGMEHHVSDVAPAFAQFLKRQGSLP